MELTIMDWKKIVNPHGDLIALASDLWMVEGTIKRNPLPRNMIVWKMPHGGLLIHSAVCLEEDVMLKLDSLGPVEVIVIPCAKHRIDAPRYHERYPNALVVCPQAATQAAREVVPKVESMEELLPQYGIKLHTPTGLKPHELCLEVPLADGGVALIVNDHLFNLGAKPPKGFGGFMLKLLGSVRPFGITPLGKRLLLEDANVFMEFLIHLSKIENIRILTVSHGEPITTSVSKQLIQAADRI